MDLRQSKRTGKLRKPNPLCIISRDSRSASFCCNHVNLLNVPTHHVSEAQVSHNNRSAALLRGTDRRRKGAESGVATV